MKCPTCSKTIGDKGSMTQWMGLGDECKCALLAREPDSPRLKVQPAVKKDCTLCGKRLPDKIGSLTHWIFSGDVCSCQRAMLREKTKKPALVVITRDLKRFCANTLTSIDTGNFGFRNRELNGIDHQDLIATRSGDDNDTLVLPELAKPKPPQQKNLDPVERRLLRDGALFWGILLCVVFIGVVCSQNSHEERRPYSPNNHVEKTKPISEPIPAIGVGDEKLNVIDGDWHPEFYKGRMPSPFVLDDSSSFQDFVEEAPIVCTHVMVGSMSPEQIRSLAVVENADVEVVSKEVRNEDLTSIASLRNIYSLDLIKASGFSEPGILALAKSDSLQLVRFKSKDSKNVPVAFLHSGWRRVMASGTGVFVYRRTPK